MEFLVGPSENTVLSGPVLRRIDCLRFRQQGHGGDSKVKYLCKVMSALVCTSALVFAAADDAQAEAIDLNFTGATLYSVNPLVTTPANDPWNGVGDPLPTGAVAAGNDYVEDPDGNGIVFNVSGITVTVTSNELAYGDIHGPKGGFGVHDTAAAAGSNDNIQMNETITFTFDSEVYIGSGIFFGADHGIDNFQSGEQFRVIVDGVAHDFDFDTGSSALEGMVSLGLTGKVFTFVRLGESGGVDGEDFYVSMLGDVVETPEPSTIVLMGAAGLGLILLGRRRRKLAMDASA